MVEHVAVYCLASQIGEGAHVAVLTFTAYLVTSAVDEGNASLFVIKRDYASFMTGLAQQVYGTTCIVQKQLGMSTAIEHCYTEVVLLVSSVYETQEVYARGILLIPVRWPSFTEFVFPGPEDSEDTEGGGAGVGRSSRGRPLKINRAVKRFIESEV